ncbi:MAG: restriction endonuclease subunit S [Flavobacteriia bacterium]|nr:restriction endonuclease subunit S [Flavobacteriia bacterium]
MKQGWEIKQLGDVCDKASSNVSQNQLDNEVGEYPIFGASGFIKNVSFYHQAKPYLSIVKDGSGVGRVTKMDAYTSVIGTLQYILPNEGIDLDYLNYSLMSIDFKKYVAGAAIPHIYFKDYKNEPFLWMPLSEQQQIVSILNEAFGNIAKAKTNAEQNLKNAKELFESYLQGVFENGNWETKTIQEVTKVINGYAFASKDFKSTNTIKSIKITNVGVKEFVEEVDNYLPEKYKDTLKEVQVTEGNIVIALTRTIISAGLKVAVVPASYDGALVNQRVAALVPNEKIINQRYLYNFLTTDGVAKYVLAHVNTLMQPNLSINDLKNLPVPCPSLKEQNEIVSKLDGLRNEVEKLKSVYQNKIADLDELKKSVLQKAFNGELKTNEVAV